MTPKTFTETTETQTPETEPQAENKCAHHWIIEPPSQPISKGVCKLCGAEKDFENWGFDTDQPRQI